RGERVLENTKAKVWGNKEPRGRNKDVKTYAAEKRLRAGFNDINERMRGAFAAAARHYADGNALFEIGSVASLSLVLYVSLRFLRISGTEIMVLLFLFGRLMPRFSILHQNYQSLLSVMPAFAHLIEIKTRCLEEAEPETGIP